MTSRILIVAEHDGATLARATSRLVSAATTLAGSEITVALFVAPGDSECAEALAATAAALAGVNAVRVLRSAANTSALAVALAPQIAELAPGFSHVFAPATTFGKDLLPRVAALLGTPQISDVIAIDSAKRFRRPIHAGNAIATVEVEASPVVATIRPSAYDDAAPAASPAPIETIDADVRAPDHTRFVARQGGGGGRADLQSAARVVSGGRGMASAEGFERLSRLADLLGAAIGATRAAVDAGFAPNELQVGQTGKVIAPELYIALGISGAIQHLAGIRDARTIVAINRDSEAPIFEAADIGLVGDLFEVLPELEALLEEAVGPR